MVSRSNPAAARAVIFTAVVAASGCASQAYDPAPPGDAPVKTFAFTAPLDLERSYRLLHERLEACAGTGHHVQPRYEHAPQRAWIMVVSGIGLDRYSFLGNRFEARFELLPAPGGTRVEASWLAAGMDSLVRASENWLAHGDRRCGV